MRSYCFSTFDSKSGQLKIIAEKGHVIRLSGSVSTLQKTGGRLAGENIGWKQASTFSGFCGKHDNELFEEIDNNPLCPNEEQVFLYAYRCLCREYFVKKNASDLMRKYKDHEGLSEPVRKFFQASGLGHTLGFENLKQHKYEYDKSLSEEKYLDIIYVCFISHDQWNIQLSGLLYPDFDFHGNMIQDPSDLESIPQLITLFTAPMSSGWAFVFAWHKTSNEACSHLLSSLAAHCHEGNIATDALLRFTFSSCENHAIRPSWWEGIGEKNQDKIADRATLMVAPNIPIPPGYLISGLENIATWDFERVITTMNNHPTKA